MTALEQHIRELDVIFQNPDRYEAHRQAAPVLDRMARNPLIMHDVIRKNLMSDNLFTSKKTAPVIGFDIEIKRNYTFSAHCFFPLPNRAKNISHNWIHHHDHSLLTTINAFGEEGYFSYLFNTDYKYDPQTKRASNLHIEKEFTHSLYNIEFCDAFVPHVVFWPPTLTITYALWSFDHVPKFNAIRDSSFFQAIKGPLKKLIGIFKVEKALDVETETEDRQFAPEGDHFVCVGNKQYAIADNANYLQNLFYILQETGFKDEAFLGNLKMRAQAKERADVVNWIEKLLNGVQIEDLYDPAQLNTPGINFSREAVMAASNSN